jgi:hypothetical protein
VRSLKSEERSFGTTGNWEGEKSRQRPKMRAVSGIDELHFTVNKKNMNGI